MITKAILSILLGIIVFTCHGQAITDSVKKSLQQEDTTTYSKVEIESEFPGGPAAWQRFLDRHLSNPNTEDTKKYVVVQFIVDKQGHTSAISVLSGPEKGGYREEAIRLIQKSGLWLSAIQNGRQVKSYKKFVITF